MRLRINQCSILHPIFWYVGSGAGESRRYALYTLFILNVCMMCVKDRVDCILTVWFSDYSVGCVVGCVVFILFVYYMTCNHLSVFVEIWMTPINLTFSLVPISSILRAYCQWSTAQPFSTMYKDMMCSVSHSEKQAEYLNSSSLNGGFASQFIHEWQ